MDVEFRRSGSYIAGRSILPRCLALPIKALADKLGHFPFMEYSSSYALQNYRKVSSTAMAGELASKEEWVSAL